MEDTLTSGAFGLLTVLPTWYVQAWLARARRLDHTPLAIPPSISVETAFWPQLDGGACEPDVLASFTCADGQVVGALIEVKYKSDMSGWPTAVENDATLRSQLGREWEALRSSPADIFPGQPLELQRRILVYVTTGATLPKATFEVVAKELETKGGDAAGFRSGAYWVSWFALAEIAREALETRELVHVERVALLRLLAFLAVRKLVAFSGLERPNARIRIAWEYAPRPSAYPIAPAPRRVTWTYSMGRMIR